MKKFHIKNTEWKECLIKSSTTNSERQSWEQIAQCAHNSSSAARCFDHYATKEIIKTMKCAGLYHKKQLETTFKLDHKVTQTSSLWLIGAALFEIKGHTLREVDSSFSNLFLSESSLCSQTDDNWIENERKHMCKRPIFYNQATSMV